MGYETWLHTFQYDRSRAEQLNEVAARVSYYPRHRSVIRQLSHIPYIVSSRHCSKLLDDLLSDNAPILFEGLHCCAFLSDKRLKDRVKLVRMQDIRVEKILLRTRSCQIGKIRKDTPACRCHFSDLRERPLLFLVEIPANSGVAASRLSRIHRSSPCRPEGELYPLSRKPFGRREHRSRRIPVTASRPAHTRHIMDIRRKKSPGNTRSAGRTDTRRTTHRQSLGRTNEPPY